MFVMSTPQHQPTSRWSTSYYGRCLRGAPRHFSVDFRGLEKSRGLPLKHESKGFLRSFFDMFIKYNGKKIESPGSLSVHSCSFPILFLWILGPVLAQNLISQLCKTAHLRVPYETLQWWRLSASTVPTMPLVPMVRAFRPCTWQVEIAKTWGVPKMGEKCLKNDWVTFSKLIS